MEAIKLDVFKGERPLIAEQLLSPSDSAEAVDCFIQAGNLQAMPGNTLFTAGIATLLTAIRSAYNFNGTWLMFDVDTDVTNTFNPSDPYDRRVYTLANSTVPQVYSPYVASAGEYISTRTFYAAGLSPTPAASFENFGEGVAISHDGNVLAVGAPRYGGFPGNVFVYERSGSTWVLRADIRTDSPPSTSHTSNDYTFGKALALDNDGSTLVIGDPSETGTTAGSALVGTVLVYEWSGTAYVETDNFRADGLVPAAAPQEFGTGVDITSDGATLIVGHRDRTGAFVDNAAFVFDKVAGVWTEIGDVLTIAPPSDLDSFDRSNELASEVAISADGKYLAIADQFMDLGAESAVGNVWVYERFSTTFFEIANIGRDYPPLGYGSTSDEFGRAIAFRGDGKTLVVSAEFGLIPSNDPKAIVYEKTANGWLQLETITMTQDRAPQSIALSEDLTSQIHGYPWADPDATYSNVGDVEEYTYTVEESLDTPGVNLGLPSPPAPIMGKTGAPSGVNETRFYVTTYVNFFGDEGPPSLPSNELEITTGETATFTTPPAPSGNYNISRCRVYRTSTGSESTEFLLVGEYLLDVASTDAVPADNLGEALATESFIAPNGEMHGLMAMQNNFLAGFYDNVVAMSEPGYYYAWPVEYRFKTEAPIVGIKPLEGNALLATTTAFPYLLVGNEPSAMTMQRLEELESCTSKRGMVEMPGSVIYPSPNGLIKVSLGGIENITQSIFSKEQWSAFNLSAIRCVRWNELCLCLFEDATVTTGFAINPKFPELGIVTLSNYDDGALFSDKADDILYWLTLNAGDVDVYKIGDPGATKLATASWTSKRFELGEGMNPAVVRVLADDSAYPLTVDITAGVDTKSVTITNSDFTYVPKTDKTDTLYGTSVQVKIYNFTDAVREVVVAASMGAAKEAVS